MQITRTSLFATHCDNLLGKQAIGFFQAKGCMTKIICGGDPAPIPDLVPFVTTDRVRYSSRYLRLLPHDCTGRRAQVERDLLIELMPWLERSVMIVCINPLHASGPNGCFADTDKKRHRSGFERALAQLLRYDSEQVLTPKRPDRERQAAARARKRESVREGASLSL